MIYLKWFIITLFDYLMLLTVPIAAPIIATFTREGSYLHSEYTWGWIWGTYDNPPQGDEGFVKKRAWFPGVTTGFKGYLNRVNWMLRNPLYGIAKITSVDYDEDLVFKVVGDQNISDKEMRPGYYLAKVYDDDELVAFEFYCVIPWKIQPFKQKRDLRMRLGWKVLTDKFKRNGFAQLVNTINPFDGYGDE